MGTIVPDSNTGKLTFYEAHFSPWTANAVAIGLTPEAVTALGTKIDASRTAYDNMIAQRNAAKAATQNFYDTVIDMHASPGAGADMIAAIKNFAQTTDNPQVYTLAEIPPPATPAPAPAPGRPYRFEVELRPLGSIALGWKCDNPRGVYGTLYEVRRRIGTAGEFVLIGSSGEKSFVDETLPSDAGAAEGGVTYAITAVRSTVRGIEGVVTVNFGVGTGGGMSVTSSDGGSVKLAA